MPAVLGGGIGGLAAAYYLSRRYVNPVSIYETSTRLGGWIRSERFEDKNFLFESGPRTIRTVGPGALNTLQMIEDLHLENDVRAVCKTHPAAKNRMIYAKGELCTLPNSWGGIFRTKRPFTKPLISALFHDLRALKEKKKLDDEPIYDFVERRFGTEIAEYAISPIICGICAGNAKEISVRFLMSELFDWEQKHGSVVKGFLLNTKKTPPTIPPPDNDIIRTAKEDNWSIYSLEGGLEQLPKTLGNYLQNYAEINLCSTCEKITFLPDGTAEIVVNGKTMPTDHIVSSIPAFKLASLVNDQHPTLSHLLNTVTYVDVAVANLQYSTPNVLKHNAFGFLVPPIENLPILGVIFDSCCFDMRGNTVVTCMMGGHWFEKIFGKSPSQKEILDTAYRSLKDILDINKEAKTTRVHILRKCIPQYRVGHRVRVEEMRNYIKKYSLPLTLCGAAYDGVGVNDVIFSARKEIDKIVGVS